MLAVLLLASLVHPHLVAHAGRNARVEACSNGACATWVEFPRSEARAIHEVALSRSGRHFFVWSQRDGHSRELDLYETPRDGGHARLVQHLVPGFGGEWRWLEGERLLQIWGCGSACANIHVFDETGLRLTVNGSWAEASPDGTHVVVADAGGRIVLIDARDMTRRDHAATSGPGMPTAVAWLPRGVAVTFNGAPRPVIVTR